MRRAARVDENQKEIVEALRKLGAVVIHTHTLKNAFDVLVAYAGKLHIMEIKNPKQPPSKRKLTEGEAKLSEQLQQVRVKYNVVHSVDEAIAVLFAD
jgi:hypothetical protein